VDHKVDTYVFWNPKTKHSLESRSAVFLQQNYGTFNKLNKSEIATQFSAITDELTQMYDTDEDVTPVDEEGNNLPNLSHLEDEESYISDGCPTEAEEYLTMKSMLMRMKKNMIMRMRKFFRKDEKVEAALHKRADYKKQHS
jgi:hypothetical protein